MPDVSKKMARIEKHVGSIRKMIRKDKSYPQLMRQICVVHSELENVEEIIVQDLAERH